MKMVKNGKLDIYKCLLCIFLVYFIGFCVFFSYQNKILDVDTEGLTQIEYIHSEMQRLSKLELEYIVDDDLIEILDNAINRLFLDEDTARYFDENSDMVLIFKNIVVEWNVYREAILQFRLDNNRDALFTASEHIYDTLENILIEIKAYMSEFADRIQTLQTYLIVNIVVITLLLLKILFDTGEELKKNKELSKDMFIDMATGVYNSMKCKEILTFPINMNDTNEVAILIFDLNDLKKTNDLYGHQAGDQLISSFVEQLNKATEMFKNEPFIGRYGGDEFVVYFESTTQEDVEAYIEKVYYLMQVFNDEKERNFKISCAVGYSMTTPETKKETTMQHLFDTADENMYQNKIAMKAKKKKELEAQGIVEEPVVDDRLS